MKKDKLTNQDKKFIKEVVETGNGTKSAKKAYGIKNEGYARVKAHDVLTKPNIQAAIKSIADALPEEELIAKHKELLNAVNLEKLAFNGNDTNEEITEVIKQMPGYSLLYIKEVINTDGRITDKYAYVKAPDNMTQDKALDKAYKIKGTYAPDKNVNVNLDINVGLTDDEKQSLLSLLK